METIIVNLTLLKINGELENLSDDIHPADTYQEILDSPELREKLLVYILGRVPNRYAALSSEKIITISPESLYCSTLERLELAEIVQKGVENLIKPESNNSFPFNQRDIV